MAFGFSREERYKKVIVNSNNLSRKKILEFIAAHKKAQHIDEVRGYINTLIAELEGIYDRADMLVAHNGIQIDKIYLQNEVYSAIEEAYTLIFQRLGKADTPYFYELKELAILLAITGRIIEKYMIAHVSKKMERYSHIVKQIKDNIIAYVLSLMYPISRMPQNTINMEKIRDFTLLWFFVDTPGVGSKEQLMGDYGFRLINKEIDLWGKATEKWHTAFAYNKNFC